MKLHKRHSLLSKTLVAAIIAFTTTMYAHAHEAHNLVGQLATTDKEKLMRQGQPEVLKVAEEAALEERGALAALSEKYKALGRPKVVILWNKEVTDLTAPHRVDYERLNLKRYVENFRDRSKTEQEILIEKGTLTRNSDANPNLQKESDWYLRTGYVRALLNAGVHAIDRNVVIRNYSLDHRARELNSQQLEVAALKSSASLILEIQATKSGNGQQWTINSRLKAVNSGKIVIESIYHSPGNNSEAQAAINSTPRKFTADPENGGYKIRTESKNLIHPEEQTGSDAATSLLTDWIDMHQRSLKR